MDVANASIPKVMSSGDVFPVQTSAVERAQAD